MNQNYRLFLDVTIATINKNDRSINKKKPHLTLIMINPRIILHNPTGSYIQKHPNYNLYTTVVYSDVETAGHIVHSPVNVW